MCERQCRPYPPQKGDQINYSYSDYYASIARGLAQACAGKKARNLDIFCAVIALSLQSISRNSTGEDFPATR